MIATLFSPTRALLIILLDAWKRLRCRHKPVPDSFGYPRCLRCNTPLL